MSPGPAGYGDRPPSGAPTPRGSHHDLFRARPPGYGRRGRLGPIPESAGPRPRRSGPRTGLLLLAGSSEGAVDELVGGVRVWEAPHALAAEREQRSERAALSVEPLVVPDEVPARVRRLVHVEGSG